MSIRKVGGPKGPPSTTPAAGAGTVRGATGADFKATLGDVKNVEGVAPVASSALLARVQAGEITREEYVAARVQQATAHLKGLPPAEIEAIQHELKELCETDPLLQELVGRATG
jgi:hypothetical protein